MADPSNSGNLNKKLLCALELLESSSSSDENINFEVIKQLKTIRKRPRVKIFIEDVVLQYNDQEFKKHLRLNKATATIFIEMYEKSDFFNNDKTHGGKEIIMAEKQIYSFLWYAGNKVCMRNVAELFNFSESTFHSILSKIMNFLLSIAPTIISIPGTEEALQDAAEEFKKISGFPSTIGCVDGTYINIRNPAHKIKSTYVNRHDLTALTLQGICDYKRRFIDVFTGVSGKLHDSRVYSLSFISKEIPQLLQGRYHLLGDAAYPLSENLLTPYRDYGHLTRIQRNYNYKFCATRVLIENSFGILKGRFRQLLQLEFHSVERCSKFIVSCCVLHNLCIDNNDILAEDDEVIENNVTLPLNQINNNIRILGEIKRNRIANMLFI